jgi:hypothetical protein
MQTTKGKPMADDDDQVKDGVALDEEDDVSAALRAAMGETSDKSKDDEEEDIGGFNRPFEEDADAPSKNHVSEEEGQKRVEDARDKEIGSDAAVKPKTSEEGEDGKTPKSKDETGKTDDETDKTKDDTGEKASDKDAVNDKPGEALSDEDYTKAIADLPAGLKSRIEQDRADLDQVLAPLKGMEDEMKALGTTPKGAMEFFVNANNYANKDPGAYVAWALGQSTGGDPERITQELSKAAATYGFELFSSNAENIGEGLKKLAEKHGYDLTKKDDDDDDDPFMSDEQRRIKELEAENKRLKSGGEKDTDPAGGTNTPPTPGNAPFMQPSADEQRSMIMSVMTETDADQKLVRPHFEKLLPAITGIINQYARSGRAMTKETLQEAYEAAELASPEFRQSAIDRMTAQKSAADSDADVRKEVKQNAEASAKAEAASSKIIDVPGQSAQHQPADSAADLSIEAFLRKQFNPD